MKIWLTRYIRYTYIAVLPVLGSSCIEDYDDCEFHGYEVQISVKDINYANIEDFPQLEIKDADMPFRSFVETVCYVLSDKDGKRIKESEVMKVEGESRTFPISFRNIPEGEYILTIWGNLTEGYPAEILHPDKKEHTDVYMGSQTLRIDESYETELIPIERTKGLLLVMCSGFPCRVSKMKMCISDIYQYVDREFNYGGQGEVKKDMPLQPLAATYLAPSSIKGANLKIEFYTDEAEEEESFLKLPDIRLNIRRNEIASVAVNYCKDDGVYEIWTLTYGQWTMIHRLTLN